ncbi:MAG: hypothetical protein ACOY5W_07045 [Pseudomonadota bacterium]
MPIHQPLRLAALMAAAPLGLLSVAADAGNTDTDQPAFEHTYAQERARFRYLDIVRVINNRGAKGELAPQVRFTSPLNDARVARGDGVVGAGSTNGTGFAINLEIFTRDETPVKLHEATQVPSKPGIRHADLLGQLNPEFPGLFVFIDKDLIKPDGGIIPKNTNLATLFNVAGTDDTPGPGVTAWVGWHVLESLPPGTDKFTITAAVVDKEGRIGFDKISVKVDPELSSGNALTPDPSTYPGAGVISDNGPKVEIVAPRVPSSIAVGDQAQLPTEETGSLNFIQVNILDLAAAGIAVDELGDTVTAPELGPGSILDPTQLGIGPNRNFPGLDFSFDVPLQAPTGVLVPAGGNLTPVFNIVGSEIDPNTGAVRVVADWVVGGSLILPPGREFVTFTAKVTDNQGQTGISERRFRISETLGGQLLTPAP